MKTNKINSKIKSGIIALGLVGIGYFGGNLLKNSFTSLNEDLNFPRNESSLEAITANLMGDGDSTDFILVKEGVPISAFLDKGEGNYEKLNPIRLEKGCYIYEGTEHSYVEGETPGKLSYRPEFK